MECGCAQFWGGGEPRFSKKMAGILLTDLISVFKLLDGWQRERTSAESPLIFGHGWDANELSSRKVIS
jgi:hypothetical protein